MNVIIQIAMNITQIFSGASLKANLDEFLMRHDLMRSPPFLVDHLGEREADSIKNATCIYIKNLLLNYSKEMYDYFRYEVDYLMNQVYEETAPKSRKRRRLLTYSEKIKQLEKQQNPHVKPEEPPKKTQLLRTRTGYLMFCKQLRENVPNYRAAQPQTQWRDLSPELKHEWSLLAKKSKPIKWSQKTTFKSKFGKERFENNLRNEHVSNKVEIEEKDSESSSEHDSDTSLSSLGNVHPEEAESLPQNFPPLIHGYGFKRPAHPIVYFSDSDSDSDSTETEEDDTSVHL